MAREQATSDFLEELSTNCTYLDPLGFWGVLGNLYQQMKKVLISGTLSRDTCKYFRKCTRGLDGEVMLLVLLNILKFQISRWLLIKSDRLTFASL